MSGGGASTTPTAQQSSSGPWSYLAPYLQQGYKEAARAYATGPAQYTPWSQVAEQNPYQKAALSGIEQYVTNPQLQQAIGQEQGLVQGLMSGSANPYNATQSAALSSALKPITDNSLYDPSTGINRMMYQTTSDPALQAQMAKGLGATSNLFGNISGQLQGGDIAQKIAEQGRAQSTASNLLNTLSGAYTAQNTQRLAASDLAQKIEQNKAQLGENLAQTGSEFGNKLQQLGMSYAPQSLNAPIGLIGQLQKAGEAQQQYNQQQLADATNRWNYQQKAPLMNLQQYASMINPSSQWGVSDTRGTQTTMTPGSGSGIGSGVGSLLGMIAGALLAPATGGASLLAAASLGGMAGGAAGGLLGGAVK